jgi:hypothetical protein
MGKPDVRAWRQAKAKAATAAEKRAWRRDHPGTPWPEHLCGLTAAEYTKYQRWLAKYQKQTDELLKTKD